MTDLNTYVQKWNLFEPSLLTTTFTSEVYKTNRDGGTVILKLLNDVGVEDESTGAIALEYFDGEGAVRLINHDERAHLLEFADGDDLRAVFDRGDDEGATRLIAQALNTLHTKRDTPIPNGLVSLKTRFSCLFEYARGSDADPIYKYGAELAEKLLDSEQDICVLHGDMHHENLINSKRGWLAIDPKGLIGERTFDAANTFGNPHHDSIYTEDRFLKTADILAEEMGLDRQRLIQFAFAFSCLSAVWSISDDQDPTGALKIAKIAQPHVHL